MFRKSAQEIWDETHLCAQKWATDFMSYHFYISIYMSVSVFYMEVYKVWITKVMKKIFTRVKIVDVQVMITSNTTEIGPV